MFFSLSFFLIYVFDFCSNRILAEKFILISINVNLNYFKVSEKVSKKATFATFSKIKGKRGGREKALSFHFL